ncbi:MAG: hypothetical protein WD645_06015 [Dehalococcoidia bacterium]
MEDLFGILVLLAVVLFPIVRWFLSGREGGGTPSEGRTSQGQPSQERRAGPVYAAAEERAYGQQDAGAGPSDPTAMGQELGRPSRALTEGGTRMAGTRLGAPVGTGQGTVDATAAAEAEEQPIREELPRAAPAAASAAEDGAPLRRSVWQQPRVTTANRRALVQRLRSRSGMRQAFLVQAIIGPPKALQSEEAGSPGG